MTTVVISPHLDDAVLSLGQFMATEPSIVVTVLAGIPFDGVSEYDESRGFASSVDAMNERRTEDEKACGSLGAAVCHLDFLDRQYQVPRVPSAIAAALEEWTGPTSRTYAPLGIGHPDHVLIARCARAAVPDLGELIVYEEFPYRSLWPEQVGPALDEIRSEGFTVEPYAVNQGPRKEKRDALACYRSQNMDLNDPCLYVPERCWRITL